MSRQIQIRRGSATDHANFTGAIGEITMDTTNKTLRVHDGTTAGGTILAKQSEIPDLSTADYVIQSQLPTASNNYTWYRKYKSGWVEQGGISPTSSITAGNGKSISITYPIEMANTNYTVMLTLISGDFGSLKITRNTTGGSATIFNRSAASTYNYQAIWYVSGLHS